MSNQESNPAISPGNWNVPNVLTMVRIVLAFVLFGLLECQYYTAGLVLFLIAVSTDWIDGWWARKFHQCTVFGRIMDPFADKLIVCGTLIYLVTIPAIIEVRMGLAVWMVVVIITRELLVTTLRAFLEQQGRDFSAKMSGKLKMWFQCVAIPACLLWVIFYNPKFPPIAIGLLMIVSVWATLIITVYSGVLYIIAALKLK
jgi:CDP-diacylglycerol--glycerol-3-phosphate 3-phosphatidyltransferase